MEFIKKWLFDNEYAATVAHITCLLSAILFLGCTTSIQTVIVWSIVFVVYYIILHMCCIVIDNFYYLDNNSESKRRNILQITRLIFILSVHLLIIMGGLFSQSPVTMLLAHLVIIMSILYWRISTWWDSLTHLLCFDENYQPYLTVIYENPINTKGHILFEKYPVLCGIIYYGSLFLMIIIPTIFLPVSVIVKIIIIVGYITIIPIVTLIADDGANIEIIIDGR